MLQPDRMQNHLKLCSLTAIVMALLSVPLRAEFLYVANSDGSNVSGYQIQANGSLKPVPGSPFASGKWPASVTVDPVGHFLYTANMGDDTVSNYRIEWNGALTRLANYQAGTMPKALSVDPVRRLLYVTDLDGVGIPGLGGTVDHVTVFRINVNGTLRPVPGSPFPAGFTALAVQAVPPGGFAYVGNAGSQEETTENISAYSVLSTGTLVPVPASPFRDGESPQSLAADPFGRFLYSAGEYDLALQTYQLTGSGALKNLPSSSFHTVAGYQPWNAVLADPLARFVYTCSGLGVDPAAATLSIYRVGANGLSLASTYPAGFFCDAMAADSSGQYLYAAMNMVKGTFKPIDGTGVAAYRINANGALAPVPGSPFIVGFSPDSMAVSPW
jgi:6-phosphogluconolactonase (cycloisomerase 2 family)